MYGVILMANCSNLHSKITRFVQNTKYAQITAQLWYQFDKNVLFLSKRIILGGRLELFTMIFAPYMYTFPESGDLELTFGDEFSCICMTVYSQDIPKVDKNTEIRSIRSISPNESLWKHDSGRVYMYRVIFMANCSNLYSKITRFGQNTKYAQISSQYWYQFDQNICCFSQNALF